MLAFCQSRSRRQHVIPEPQPSSCGSICQGRRCEGHRECVCQTYKLEQRYRKLARAVAIARMLREPDE